MNEDRGGLTRGVATIVIGGIVLGLLYNSLLLAADKASGSGPRHGVPWIRREVKTRKLMGAALDGSAESNATFALAVATSATDGVIALASDDGATGASATVATTTTSAPDTVKSAKPHRKHRTVRRKAAVLGTTKTTKTTTTTTAAKPAPRPAAKAATTPARPVQTATAPPATLDLPTVPDSDQPLEADYAMVKKFWDAKAALFLDAREASEYAEGHIPGALSLPYDDVFKDPDKAKSVNSNGRVIVTYCSGGDCELSKNLAAALIDAGHKKVLVFTGGMPGWKEGGAPVATGTEPGAKP